MWGIKWAVVAATLLTAIPAMYTQVLTTAETAIASAIPPLAERTITNRGCRTP